MYGNGGANGITLGDGSDTVFAYGGPNTVKVGDGPDAIYAYGTGNYTTGSGMDMIFAQFSRGDTIKCGSSHTTVYTVRGTNSTSSNCTVRFVAPETVPGQAASARRLARTAAAKVTAKEAA